ncbi:rifin [Plasmodium falciparum NF54]|uniref:Rifin n=2 Tax=Plasmodium falciparum TaxID=5833 RepID=Q8IJ09_PLAF7|nr:rifin [Plasmodium falciparum 3D7]KAF4330841.1 rifin [Plasmodium falciparum NF54]PKC43520.1 rifin [Plasmodium falciparum NF54]CZT98655.1 rifin [Plasmodium falciparum 3D7]|eukprot:XP_001347677.1 rifin [Plasmodium falciparum 3D7]
MKVHCYNILLFSFTLIILLLSSSQVNNQMNHYNRAHMKNIEPTKSYRSLCECELYTSMYDDDPEMKEIMHDFDRQTSQRFEEYNERMNKNRQKCKEQCNRDIKNIILKDKIEKELKQQLATLETDISTDDIPTCVCNKSVADKVEKTCLKCGGVLGGAVPELGLLCGYGAYELVKVAIGAAEKAAIAEGAKAGIAEGIRVAIKGIKGAFNIEFLDGKTLAEVITGKTFNNSTFFVEKFVQEYNTVCLSSTTYQDTLFCDYGSMFGGKVDNITAISLNAKNTAIKAGQAAAKMTTETTKALTAEKTGEVTSTSAIFSNPMVISFIVVVIIVIILLIIYLILRYRRKKKMKRKLQYIKLLE